MKLNNVGNVLLSTELVINPMYRGKGLGKILVESCLKFVGKIGYDYVYAFTTNVLMEKFYNQFGFEKIDQFNNQEDDSDDVWFRCKLKK